MKLRARHLAVLAGAIGIGLSSSRADDPKAPDGGVDPVVVGSWRHEEGEKPNLTVSTLTVTASGTYTLVVTGAKEFGESGTIEAGSGSYRLLADKTGRKDEGACTVEGKKLTLTPKGKKPIVWTQAPRPKTIDEAAEFKIPGPDWTPPAGVQDWLDGLDALEKADGKAAEEAFSKSIAAASETFYFYDCRGVARVLQAKVGEAMRDFAKSSNLFQGAGTCAELWSKAISGKVYRYQTGPEAGEPNDRRFATGNLEVLLNACLHLNAPAAELAAEAGEDEQAKVPEAARKSGSEQVERIIESLEKTGKLPDDLAKQPLVGNHGQPTVAGVLVGRAYARIACKKSHELAVTKELPAIGRAFATMVKHGLYRSQGLTLLLYRRAAARDAAGEHARAAADAKCVLAAWADELDAVKALEIYTRSVHATGDAWTARGMYTYVLSSQTRSAAAYLGRALANAQLGEVARARADLEVARKIDAKLAADAAPKVEEAIARLGVDPATLSPHDAATALEEAVKSGADFEAQVEKGRIVILAMNARRLRGDELYQDRLRQLMEAYRKDPENPDRLADVGAFLFYEAHDVHGEEIEPGAGFRSYRYQTAGTRSGEEVAAEVFIDKALSLAPNHVRANCWKARICMWFLRFEDAEPYLHRALAKGPNDPETLGTWAELCMIVANQKFTDANDLRSPKSWNDGWFRITEFPSPADLARADDLEARGHDLEAEAATVLEKGAKANAGKPLGSLLMAVLCRTRGQNAEALAAFQESIKLDSKLYQSYFPIAQILDEAGRFEDAAYVRLAGVNLIETTAAPVLRLAGCCMVTTRWASARKALAAARQTDPSDARTFDYLALCALGEGSEEGADAAAKGAEALACTRCALAIREAAARLGGKTTHPGRKGAPLDDEYLRAMQVHYMVASALRLAGKTEDAITEYKLIASYEEVLGPARLYATANGGKLPYNAAMVADFHSPNAATFIRWTHIALAEVYRRQKKNQEAADELELVRKAGIHDLAESVALVYLGKLALEAGDTNNAALCVQFSNPRDMPDRYYDDRRAVALELVKIWDSKQPTKDPQKGYVYPPGWLQQACKERPKQK
jgi:tetratricopeptide (TPR) repeat protein